MMISNHDQLVLIWQCLGCGVWLDLSWILLDRLRLRFRLKPMRFLFDIVAAVSSGFCLFMFALAVSGGELRFGMLLAATVGAGVSHLSAGRLLIAALNGFDAIADAAEHLRKRLGAKTAVLWQKMRKKVELFYKKHLQSMPS